MTATVNTSGFATTVLVGVGLGVGSRLVDFVAPRWVGNIAAFWVVAAFLIARHRPSQGAAVNGAVCLIAASLAYYAWRLAVDQTISLRYLTSVGLFWLLVAAAIGAISGWVGGRSAAQPFTWGWPAGVFLGELCAVLLLSQRWPQVVLEGVAVIVCCSQARTDTSRALLLTVTVAAGILGTAVAYRLLLG